MRCLRQHYWPPVAPWPLRPQKQIGSREKPPVRCLDFHPILQLWNAQYSEAVYRHHLKDAPQKSRHAHRVRGDRHVRDNGGGIRNRRNNLNNRNRDSNRSQTKDSSCSHTMDNSCSTPRNPSPSQSPTSYSRGNKCFQLPHKPGPRSNQRGALRPRPERLKPPLEPMPRHSARPAGLEPGRRPVARLRLAPPSARGQQAGGNSEARPTHAKRFHWSEAPPDPRR